MIINEILMVENFMIINNKFLELKIHLTSKYKFMKSIITWLGIGAILAFICISIQCNKLGFICLLASGVVVIKEEFNIMITNRIINEIKKEIEDEKSN